MKKTFFSLALIILFIQCSPNNDMEGEEQQEVIEDLTISITIEGDFLIENQEKTLYISNEEGIIEGQISLLNNQENLLTIQRQPGTEYYAIIHDKSTINGRTNHSFDIFENMQSSEYSIKTKNWGTSGELPEVGLSIVNTGSKIELKGMSGGGRSTWSSVNGGTYEYNGTCTTKPGVYYVSLKNQEDPFARYFWAENVAEDKSFSLNYEELPIAAVVETQLPEHETGMFLYMVSGLNNHTS